MTRLTPSDKASLVADQYLVALEFEMRQHNQQREPRVPSRRAMGVIVWAEAAVIFSFLLALLWLWMW